MPRPGTGASLVARARDQRGVLAAVVVMLALSGVVTGVVWSVVADGASRAMVAAAMRADGTLASGGRDVVTVTVLSKDDAAEPGLDSGMVPVVEAAAGDVPVDISVWSQSPLLSFAGAVPRSAYLLEVDDLENSARLLEGAWPRPGRADVEVVLPAVAALAMGVETGDEVPLFATPPHEGDGQQPVVTARVVGLVELDSSPQWRRDLLQGAGIATDRGWVPTYGPLLTAAGGVSSRADGAAPARVSLVMDPDFSQGVDLPAFAHRVSRLDGQVERALGDRAAAVVTLSDVVDLQAEAARDLDVTRAVVLAVAALVVALALAALTLTGSLLVSRRGPETALLRTRGASGPQLAGRAAVEAGALAIIAAVIAVPVALATYAAALHTPALSRAWPVPTSGVPWSSEAVVAVLMGVALPALALVGAAAAAQLPTGRGVTGAAGRAGIDVAALALAATATWQLSSRGLATGASDASVVLAPALAVLATSALVVRIVPLVARLGERLAHRARGVVVPLAGWGLARAGATRGAFLFAASAAAVAFALTTLSTWNQSSIQQADLAVGADAVVTGAGAPGSGEALAGGACGAATAVMDRAISMGTRPTGTRLVALDTTAAGAVVRGDSGSDRSWQQVLAPLAPDSATVGWSLPQPSVDLEVTGALNDQGVVYHAQIAAVLQDGLGDRISTSPTSVPLDGHAHEAHLQVPGAVTAAGNWELVAFSLTVDGQLVDPSSSPTDQRVEGTVTIRPPQVATAGSWIGRGQDDGSGARVSSADVADGALNVAFTTPQFSVVWGSVHLMVLAFDPPSDVPVAVSEGLARSLCVAEGDRLNLSLDTQEVSARVAAIVPAIPSEPHHDALLADIDTLSRWLLADGFTQRLTDAWWVDLGCEASGTPTLTAASPVALLSDAREEARSGPLRAGAWWTLWLAAATAAAFAVAGAGVRAASTVRSRSVVIARLRGLGTPSRTAARAELLQHAAVVLIATLWGAAAGATVSWLLMRWVVVAPGGLPAVPPAQWHPRADWYWWLLAIAAASILVALPWVRALTRRSAASALRSGEGS